LKSYRLIGDAFSEYFLERVLFEDPKLGSAFRMDEDLVREAQRLVRDARRALAHRAAASSTESQLLRPLARLAGWSIAEDCDPVETLHGVEDGGLIVCDARGEPWARAFCAAPSDDLDATPRGRHRRFTPASTAIRVLEATGTPFAILLTRAELRLVRRADGGSVSAIAFDLDALAEWSVDGQRGWRLLLGLTSATALEKPRLLDRVVELGRRGMTDIGNRLGDQVMDAVTLLVRGFYAVDANRVHLPGAGNESGLATLYGEILTVLYRCLFALFAEARGLVPVDLPLYRDNYALSTARDAPTLGLADRLRSLFVLLRRGANLGGGERIPAFGGALFSSEAAPLVDRLHWNDETIRQVIDRLTRVDDPKRGMIPVSYRELDEERLGSIYERLLELRLSISDHPMERIRVEQREVVVDPLTLAELGGYSTAELNNDPTDEPNPDADDVESDQSRGTAGRRAVVRLESIPPGTPYLSTSSGRKESASYYTARDLVDFLVRETIDPRAERAEPSEILKLRVVDPAMGSGHFLIGAMRRLAGHLLAAYRRFEERDGFDALPPFVQSAWADERELLVLCRQLVAVHCLYGVDKNPLAVDLARVALWLATAAADHPLSFLDHRLQVGDSLLGLPLTQIVSLQGLSNPAASKGGTRQYSILSVDNVLVDEIALEHAVQNRLVQAFNVMRGFLAIIDDERQPFELKRERAAAVSSVFEPLTTLHLARLGGLLSEDESASVPPIIAALRSFASLGYLGKVERAGLEPYLARAREEKPLCWEAAFPDAYFRAEPDGSVVAREDAGFDIVLGNPPWDKLKLEQRAYYLRYDPLIVDYQGRSADERIKRVNETIPGAAPDYDRALARMARYVSTLSNTRAYVAQSVTVDGRKTGGDPDTFKYFMERAWLLARPGGLIGLVVPAAFTSGDGTTGLRRLVFDSSQLRSLFVFENRRRLFPIDSRFKFETIVFERGGSTTNFEAAFWLHETDLLSMDRAQRATKVLSISTDDIRRASPARLAILEVRSSRDLQIAQRLLSASSPLGITAREWGATFGSELHMSQDRKLFRTREWLAERGALRDGGLWISAKGERYIPLREGRMVQAFDGNAKCYVRGEGRSAEWTENGWPKASIEPHYWVREHDLEPAWTRSRRKLYWCDVTGATNERTAMAALIDEPAASGHSLAVIHLPDEQGAKLDLIAAVFNSFVFDWYIRLSVAQHLSFNFVEPAPFLRTIEYRALSTTVKHVSSETIDYAARANQRADLDSVVALGYGLSYGDLAHVLASFPLLDRAEPALGGEGRSTITRDLVLAAFCRWAGDHDPEHADRVRAARSIGAIGYVATPLRAQLGHVTGFVRQGTALVTNQYE
jgi:hypothetical protein